MQCDRRKCHWDSGNCTTAPQPSSNCGSGLPVVINFPPNFKKIETTTATEIDISCVQDNAIPGTCAESTCPNGAYCKDIFGGHLCPCRITKSNAVNEQDCYIPYKSIVPIINMPHNDGMTELWPTTSNMNRVSVNSSVVNGMYKPFEDFPPASKGFITIEHTEMGSEGTAWTNLADDTFENCTETWDIMIRYTNLRHVTSGLFKNMASLKVLGLQLNKIETIAADALQGTNIHSLVLSKNNLTNIPQGLYDGIPIMFSWVADNKLSVFDANTLYANRTTPWSVKDKVFTYLDDNYCTPDDCCGPDGLVPAFDPAQAGGCLA